MYLVELFGYGVCFVVLQGVDEMLVDWVGVCVQVGQCFDFGDVFLYVVFVEEVLFCGMGGVYGIGVECFGNGQ